MNLSIITTLRCVLQQQNSYIEADGSVTSTATPRLIIARSVQMSSGLQRIDDEFQR
uniref:Uncharacterized protein n=1 Tax=Meloidogyne enterolobii TaxID=390850 RepID=A0A6V7UBQ6_MELEN|nr:unnamed protein product [Meloidogyne enterolobii]